MAIGDDAASAGMALVPESGENGRVRWGAREINRTRDYIALVKKLIPAILGVAAGGTGANNPDAARANLNAAANPIIGGRAVGDVTATNRIGLRWNGNRPVIKVDLSEWELAFRGEALPRVGGFPVGDVTGANAIGLRWNGNRPVIRVDNSEFELARIGDIPSVPAQQETARYAQGTQQAHAREAGSNRYAVWVDGSFTFGRATSSRRYKEDIQSWEIDPARVLALEPVSFHRKVDDEGVRDHGLIAEDVHKTLPEIIQWYTDPEDPEAEPRIDGIHYDMLGVALLSVVKDQQRRIEDLERRLEGF